MTDLGAYQFTFAVVADTHINQAEDFSSSPYPCNALANARTRQVVAEVNRAKPEFVVHLGDIVNPVPELPTYDEAAEHFKTLVADLEAPLHIVPGNHDVGDKPVSWMPAGRVTDEHLSLYESHFGAHYFSVDRNGLHIVVVNAPVMNSGLEAEAAQKAWLEADLAANKDKRTFICIHYPPYVSNPDEGSSYDNIDEPARSWLLEMVERFAPEAMFCGHVHNFWYDRIAETEMYILPSTAFVRHDYQEFFRIPPTEDQQFGRNDEAKLGWFLVRVYEHGHVVENIRTYGRALDQGAGLPPAPKTITRIQPKESTIDWIGLDMRQPWAEELEITPSGAVDEFDRKLARNDYPVLALWEMGVKRLRIPAQDIVNSRTRRRVEIMRGAGHLFHVHRYGLPDARTRARLIENRHLIDTLELVLPWDEASGAMEAVADLGKHLAVPVILSRVNRKDAGKHQGGRYNHLISHGFLLDEADELADFLAKPGASLSGVMFQVARDVDPREAVDRASAFAKRTERRAVLYLKTSGVSPWEAFEDEDANVARMVAAVTAAAKAPYVDLILDTFADSDRGYFVRSGLVDRRYNPKLGSHVLGNLLAVLAHDDWASDGKSITMGGATVDLATGEISS